MNTKPQIGIVGIGVVGGTMRRYYEERCGYIRGENLFLLDSDSEKGFSDNINNADIIFICVPTPCDHEGSCNLSHVYSAVERISNEKIVVLRSTIPPGTTEKIQCQRPGIKLLFNPEFLTENQAWEDFIKPDRQIVGFTNDSIEAASIVLSVLPKAPFMSPWGVNTYTAVRITATEAELIKYCGNIWFIRKVNFANIISAVCRSMKSKLGNEVDYENVRMGVSSDHRIGDSHLDVNHGGYKGWGGTCFQKDIRAFIHHIEELSELNGGKLLRSDLDFNIKLLESQGITLEEVSRRHYQVDNK